ncbi:MAG: ABC transporter permease [Bacteriovoracia bacterium]
MIFKVLVSGLRRKFIVLRAVGRVSFREIVRDKILYNSLLCALLLLGVAFLASKLTYVRPERVVLDFGLSSVSLASAIIAILIGAPLLIREFERRTIFVALAKPISRFDFLLGKFTGLLMVLTANWAILSAVFLVILYSVGGTASVTLSWGLVLALLQSWLVAAITVFFSTFSTTSLSVMISLGVFAVGSSISQVQFLATKVESTIGRAVLQGLARVFPDFEHFQLGSKVIYELPVSLRFGVSAVLYSLFLGGFFLLLSGYLIQRREI